MDHIIDHNRYIFDDGFDLANLTATETSWAINEMKASDRDVWTIGSFGVIRPVYSRTWLEWIADPGGEDDEVDADKVVRGGAYCGCKIIELDRRTHAVKDDYAYQLLDTIMAGTDVKLGYTSFDSGTLDNARPAHNLMMIQMWRMSGRHRPLSTVGYILYLDKEGTGIEERCLAFDLRQTTSPNSWHDILPVLYSLNAMQSGRFKIAPAYHTTSAGVRVCKLVPRALQ